MAEADTLAGKIRNTISTPTISHSGSIFQSCLYDVSVPRTSEGLMLQVCSAPFLGYEANFTGYRCHNDGKKSFAETNHVIRNKGDIITAVEGLEMFGKSFDYVVNAISDKCKVQHSISLRMLDKSSFDAAVSRQNPTSSVPDKKVQKSKTVVTNTSGGAEKSPKKAKEKKKKVGKAKSSPVKSKASEIDITSPVTRSMARRITAAASKETPKAKMARKKNIVKHIVKAVKKIARVATTKRTRKARNRYVKAPDKYLVVHPKTGSQFMFHLPENVRSNELKVIFPDITLTNEGVDSLGSKEQYCVQLPGMFKVEKNSIGPPMVVNGAKQ